MAMKTISLLFLFFTTLSVTKAQDCTRSGSFVRGVPHEIKGDVLMELQSDNTLLLSFSEDFIADSGPFVDVYLANTAYVDENSRLIEKLKSYSGAQMYELPQDIDISEYEYVVVHCTEYNVIWGHALMSEATGAGCPTITSIRGQEKGRFKWFVDFSANMLDLDFEKPMYGSVSLFSSHGNFVSKAVLEGNDSVQISTIGLMEGIYVVHLTDSQGSISTQKIYLK